MTCPPSRLITLTILDERYKLLVQDPSVARPYLFSGGQNMYNGVVLVGTMNVYIPASLGRRPIPFPGTRHYRYLRYLRGCSSPYDWSGNLQNIL